ncbi:MAG: ammonium transporter, partial [Chloroflexi bacterium]|nr:ammonium transporter [Chloroflexota bacterium]
MTGYSLVFAQDITSDADKLDQSANMIWMLGAFLVFFMQAGFAFLGAGLIRAKNTTNYMTKSFMDFAIASLSFWAFGFALMWGT